jgi:hypothetical protein
MAGRGIVEPEDTVSNKRVFQLIKMDRSLSPKNHCIFMNPSEQGLTVDFLLQKHLSKKFLTAFLY